MSAGAPRGSDILSQAVCAGDDRHPDAAIIRRVNPLHRPGRNAFGPSLIHLHSRLAIRAIAPPGQAGSWSTCRN